MADPIWITTARKYLGMREIPGPKTAPFISRFLERIKAPWRDDETAWCGTFVGGVLSESGMDDKVVSGPAAARNWLKCGNKLERPAYGCIVVFWRGSRDGYSGHVGFVVGKDTAGNIMVLAGNQGDMVSIKPFPVSGPNCRILGYRWPSLAPLESRYDLPLTNSSGAISDKED